jgi:hypothetical protein
LTSCSTSSEEWAIFGVSQGCFWMIWERTWDFRLWIHLHETFWIFLEQNNHAHQVPVCSWLFDPKKVAQS